jgi:GH24 family phage-related lysozyme (muramidase)
VKRWSLRWAARFVAKWEGFVPTAYQDSGGVWTIDFGHTNGVYPGQRSNRAEGLRWLTEDLRTASVAVNRYVTRKLSVRQRIAWISFAFNCGAGALAESTALARFNAGDLDGAAEALSWWAKDASGNTLLGLERRRKAEGWLLTHPRSLKRNPHRSHPGRPQGKAHR